MKEIGVGSICPAGCRFKLYPTAVSTEWRPAIVKGIDTKNGTYVCDDLDRNRLVIKAMNKVAPNYPDQFIREVPPLHELPDPCVLVGPGDNKQEWKKST